jgi:phosphatidylserine/phosphatidylglycerophosphate/cardiolipin synthase-like enzyme
MRERLRAAHMRALYRSGRPSEALESYVAIADRRVLLVTSANLTQSGVGKNIEAGLLIRGGTVPVRAAEHIAELQANRTLVRLL